MKTFSALFCWIALFISSAVAQTPPTIASLTSSQSLTQGQSLTLSVSVNGTTPFTYQWSKDGGAIEGATSNLYTISSLATTDAGYYTVTITNSAGSITSGKVLIDVIPAEAPRFYSQPGDLNYTVGDTINLYASVSGTSPLTFVWKKGGTTIATTSNSSYSIRNVQTTDSGTYSVTVSNVAGSVTSASFTVTISPQTAPVFTSALTNRTIATGESLYYYAYLQDSDGATYQWYKDGIAIPGATSWYFSVSSAKASDAGSYTVVATNSAGSTTSSPGVVTVSPPVAPTTVSISSGPITITAGGSFSLYGYANGTSPLSYQWRKDGVNIPGATSDSLYRYSVTADDAGTYSLVVTNSVGSTTSSGTVVSIVGAQGPVITADPVSRTVYPGDSASFSVNVTGATPLTYQWKKDGVNISGATGSSYYVSSAVASSDAGTYKVTVSNAEGSVISRGANLVVLDAVAPVIQNQPASIALSAGQTINLSVTASGHPAPSYQWKKDGTNIPGATGSSYYKGNVASSDSGDYTVEVTNVAGSVTSATATVSVSEPSPPVITEHPASASLLPGGYFYGIEIGYNSGSSSTIGWARDGTPIDTPSTYNSSHSISNAQPADAGSYTATITNSAGSATSYPGVITVDLSSARPVITYTSGSRLVPSGSYVTMNIQVSPATTSYTVAWKKDGVVVPNANSLSLSFSSFAGSYAGTYIAEVTTADGTFPSQPIVLGLLDDGVAPSISVQPASSVRHVGENAGFSIQASGEVPLSYQWRKDGVNIPGATYYYYNFIVGDASEGDYTVVVTNANGSATSEAGTLTVLANSTIGAPILSSQPRSQTLVSGNSYWSVGTSVLNSTSGQTYQWYKDDVAISGATSSSYSPYHNVTSTDAGRYKVVVTNTAGSTTSDEAVITVISRSTGPTFSSQPQSQSAYVGDSVTFTVNVNSDSDVTYQWRKDGTNISGATDASLTLPDVESSDAGNYTVVATNDDGSTASAVATLTIDSGVVPHIISQPASQIGTVGDTITFRVEATGTPGPDYRWRKDGHNIAGATNSTLRLTDLQVADAGDYSVVVSNVAGSVTSHEASLKVYAHRPDAPAFTTQPVGGSFKPGGTVTLTVVVTGYPTPTLQWYHDDVAIAGATSTTLPLDDLTADDTGDYHAVATNEIGSAQSDTASVALDFSGTYIGTLSTGETWALVVQPDGTATFLGAITATGQIIFDDTVIIGPTGDFTFGGTGSPADVKKRARSTPVVQDAAATATGHFTGLISGRIDADGVTGVIDGTDTALTGAAIPPAGSASAFAGIYDAVPLGTAIGEVHALVAPDGTLLLVAVDATGVRTGIGMVSDDGTFAVSDPQFSYTGTLTSATGSISGTYQPVGGPVVVIAPSPADTGVVGRLMNVSTRGLAGVGSGTMIAGFVIAPGNAKDVLVRGVGPTLTTMQVKGALADPRLRLFKGATLSVENDDWSAGDDADSIAATSARVGAFPLPIGSADAALLIRLNPGIYTAHVTTGNNSTGIALVEVYDATETGAVAPQIVNLSTRAKVGQGDDILIVGFVIDGTAPKKLLLRGVGPGLAGQGVTGLLADPKIRLMHGSTVVAENDNWSDGADADSVAATAAAVGAQPLASGSKDAALLLYLAPGIYTAQLRGADSTTGVALVEVYDVP